MLRGGELTRVLEPQEDITARGGVGGRTGRVIRNWFNWSSGGEGDGRSEFQPRSWGFERLGCRQGSGEEASNVNTLSKRVVTKDWEAICHLHSLAR